MIGLFQHIQAVLQNIHAAILKRHTVFPIAQQCDSLIIGLEHRLLFRAVGQPRINRGNQQIQPSSRDIHRRMTPFASSSFVLGLPAGDC